MQGLLSNVLWRSQVGLSFTVWERQKDGFMGKSWALLCYFLAVWLCANCLLSLDLSFHLYKMRVMLTSEGRVKETCFLSKVSEVAQSCPTLCDPVDCSLPGSSVHGILQARVLEWAAISFSRGSSQPRDRTQVSRIAGRRFNLWATRESPKLSLAKLLSKCSLSVSRGVSWVLDFCLLKAKVHCCHELGGKGCPLPGAVTKTFSTTKGRLRLWGGESGVPNLWGSNAWSNEVELIKEIKGTINVMCLKHPKTIPSTPGP